MMQTVEYLLTETDDDGNEHTVPLSVYLVNTPAELAALLDGPDEKIED